MKHAIIQIVYQPSVNIYAKSNMNNQMYFQETNEAYDEDFSVSEHPASDEMNDSGYLNLISYLIS